MTIGMHPFYLQIEQIEPRPRRAWWKVWRERVRKWRVYFAAGGFTWGEGVHYQVGPLHDSRPEAERYRIYATHTESHSKLVTACVECGMARCYWDKFVCSKWERKSHA